mgnify:CR=1 FL=1
MVRDSGTMYAPLVLAEEVMALLHAAPIPFDEKLATLKIATELMTFFVTRTGGVRRFPIEYEVVSRDVPSQSSACLGGFV